MSSDHHHGKSAHWVAAGTGFMLGMLLFKLVFTIAALAFLGFWWWTEDITPPVLRKTIRGIAITFTVFVVLVALLIGLT